MPWISCTNESNNRGGGRAEANGILFHKDRAGGKEAKRFIVRVRIGMDALAECRYQVGDYLHLEFDPELRRVRIRRLSEHERKQGFGWKLIACNGKQNGKAGALYFKAGRIDDKWLAVLFPGDVLRYEPSAFHFDNGLVCDWPARRQ